MNRTFWIAVTLLCGLLLIFGEIEAYGQTKLICYANADSSGVMAEIPCHDADASLPNAPSSTRHPQDFKDMPAYQPKPFRPLHFLYAIHEHPRRTQIIWMIGAGIAGGLISWETRAHCDKYPPGENGVNVNCPKEYGK